MSQRRSAERASAERASVNDVPVELLDAIARHVAARDRVWLLCWRDERGHKVRRYYAGPSRPAVARGIVARYKRQPWYQQMVVSLCSDFWERLRAAAPNGYVPDDDAAQDEHMIAVFLEPVEVEDLPSVSSVQNVPSVQN